MIKRHISFDHGPPVGSHSAGLAGVVGYLFTFLHFSLYLFLSFFFTRLFQSVVCFLFALSYFLSFLSLDRRKQRETGHSKLGVAKGEIGVC